MLASRSAFPYLRNLKVTVLEFRSCRSLGEDVYSDKGSVPSTAPVEGATPAEPVSAALPFK